MQLMMIGVRDRSAEFYFPPFFVRSHVEAVRTFQRLMDDPNRSGAKSEYEMHHLADFDDQLGIVSVLPMPKLLANGADFQTMGGNNA